MLSVSFFAQLSQSFDDFDRRALGVGAGRTGILVRCRENGQNSVANELQDFSVVVMNNARDRFKELVQQIDILAPAQLLFQAR